MDLFEKEIIETLTSFQKHGVRYVLVGGFAVNYYGYSRTTADLDLWIATDPSNKENLINSLEEMGYDTKEILNMDLEGQPPIDIPIQDFKIELINYLGDIIPFEEAYELAKILELEGIAIKVLHINHLIQIKESSNRPKDLMDVEELKKIREQPS